MGIYAFVRYAYCGYAVSHIVDCKAGRVLIVLEIHTAGTTIRLLETLGSSYT